MRILFAGSPVIAVPALRALSEMECKRSFDNGKTSVERTVVELAGILTNPDAPQGRKKDLLPSDVSLATADLSAERQKNGFPSIAQFKFSKLNSIAREQIAALKCDLLVCFAYGRIFGSKFLSMFPLGGINIHPSLLPRFRGPSPIPAAILAGDRETGVTIQTLAGEMDAGHILAQEKIPLDGSETTATLGAAAAFVAARMLWDLIPAIAAGKTNPYPQQGEPVYCTLIKKDHGKIDWNLDAGLIDAQVRAYDPWPLCYTRWNGEDLFILEGWIFSAKNDPAAVNLSGTVL